MSTQTPARTYNQSHIARKYTAGKRRLSIYWTWSYPWESQRDPAAMENRFSTMTEVRTVLWPAYETPEWSAAQFLQGIAGTLELFHRSTLSFQQIAGEVTGHPVAVFQRIDQAGYKLPIDERILPTPIRCWFSDWTTFFPNRKPHQRKSPPFESGSSAKAPACCSRRITMSALPAT